MGLFGSKKDRMQLFGSKKDRMQEALAKNLKKQILGSKSVAREFEGSVESYKFDDTQYDFNMSMEDHCLKVFKGSDLIWTFNAGVRAGNYVDKTAYVIFCHLLDVCRQEWDKSNAKVEVKINKPVKNDNNSEIELLKSALEKTK